MFLSHPPAGMYPSMHRLPYVRPFPRPAMLHLRTELSSYRLPELQNTAAPDKHACTPSANNVLCSRTTACPPAGIIPNAGGDKTATSSRAWVEYFDATFSFLPKTRSIDKESLPRLSLR